METDDFTKDEKHLIARMLQKTPGRYEVVFAYGVYIFPSIVFAVYGLWKRDFVAILVAYVVFLVVALLYLDYSHSNSRLFYSLIRKYEAKVGVLRQVGDSNI